MSKPQRAPRAEGKVGGIVPPELDSKEFRDALADMKAITPVAVANRFSLRVGIAKAALEELRKRNVLKLVEGNRRIKVYARVT